ncbi:MAG TPA: hypothetical protein PKI14_12985, partial [Fervidobacterium sp.]|nr:hypothetical protein [Fervidobacterium sp.]
LKILAYTPEFTTKFNNNHYVRIVLPPNTTKYPFPSHIRYSQKISYLRLTQKPRDREDVRTHNKPLSSENDHQPGRSS